MTEPATTQANYVLVVGSNLCFWCLGPTAGTLVDGGGKRIDFREEVDHVIPKAYVRMESAGNKVASCSICNRLKGSMVFESIQAARHWINREREKRGLPFTPFGEAPPQSAMDRYEGTEWNGFQTSPCPVCGEPVVQKVRRGLPKMYCSGRCRRIAWDRAHPRLKPRARKPPTKPDTTPRRSLRAEVSPERFREIESAAKASGLSVADAVRAAVDAMFPVGGVGSREEAA